MQALLHSSRLYEWFVAILIVGVYVAVGKLSLMLAFLHPSASPVWPPTGLAIATLLILGVRYWPSILVGAFIVNATTNAGLSAAAVIAVGNALEAVVATMLIQRFAAGTKAFEKVNTVLVFIAAVVIGSVISAGMGITSLTIFDGFVSWMNTMSVWFTWWLGDVVGALVVAPLIILWLQKKRGAKNSGEIVEACVEFSFLLCISAFVFLTDHFPHSYISLLPVLWIIIRQTPRAAMTSVALLSAIAIYGTLLGMGPFAGVHPNTSLLYLQSYIATVAFTTMTFAAAMHEKNAFTESLQQGIAMRTAELQLIKEHDLSKLHQIKNMIEEMKTATIAADGHMTVLHANKKFNELFQVTDNGFSNSLLNIFKNVQPAFYEPELALDSLIRIVGEQQIVKDEKFLLRNGMVVFCDYTPIIDGGNHRGHLLSFRTVESDVRTKSR